MENIKKSRMIIYGLGAYFHNYYTPKVLDRLEREYSIVGFADKNPDAFRSINLEKYNRYTDISECIYDYICITASAHYENIRKELEEQGVEPGKFLSKEFWIEFCQNTMLPMNRVLGSGLEIGGPSSIFQAIYHTCHACDGVNYAEETVWGNNAGKKYVWKDHDLGNQIIADATDLGMIADATYDFVISSNNLEHVANPLKAVSESIRILKSGGVLIILVPCKKHTFDHRRSYTSFEHILEDYKNNVLEDDLTHLPEILEKHDLSMDLPAGSKEEFKIRSLENYKNRCLHHHVYSEELLEKIASYFKLKILENTEWGMNYYLVAEKQ